MIPFEEKFTAWVDGKLSGEELEAFERELPARPGIAAEKDDCVKMGALLRRHASAPPLSNADFFNHQLLQRIAAEAPAGKKAAGRSVEKAGSFWSFQRLILAGGFSLAIAFGLYKTAIPAGGGPPVESNYFVEVGETSVSDPNTVWTVYDKEKDMTVVWISGIEPVSIDLAR